MTTGGVTGAVGDGERVAVGVADTVAVAVGVAETVAVGFGDSVTVGAGETVAVGVAVAVAVAVAVTVGVGETVGVGSTVGVAETVGVGETVTVGVGDGLRRSGLRIVVVVAALMLRVRHPDFDLDAICALALLAPLVLAATAERLGRLIERLAASAVPAVANRATAASGATSSRAVLERRSDGRSPERRPA
ncbi:MAG: hypothetical protein ABI912_04430 [Actinomycetota bacterium]